MLAANVSRVEEENLAAGMAIAMLLLNAQTNKRVGPAEAEQVVQAPEIANIFATLIVNSVLSLMTRLDLLAVRLPHPLTHAYSAQSLCPSPQMACCRGYR